MLDQKVKKGNLFVVLSGTLVLLCLSLQSLEAKSSANKSSISVWALQQQSQIGGEFEVYVWDKGVKAHNLKKALSLLCLYPYKDVILYSTRTKKYFVTPTVDFRCPMARTLAVVNSGLLSDTPMLKKDLTTYKKLPVQSYISTAAFTARQIGRFKNHETPGRSPRDVNCFTTEAFKADEKISYVLNRFFGLPRLSGFAVYAEFDDLGGDKNKSLVTSKFSKVTMAESSLALPPELKKAAKMEELYVSADTEDEMGLMLLGH